MLAAPTNIEQALRGVEPSVLIVGNKRDAMAILASRGASALGNDGALTQTVVYETAVGNFRFKQDRSTPTGMMQIQQQKSNHNLLAARFLPTLTKQRRERMTDGEVMSFVVNQ